MRKNMRDLNDRHSKQTILYEETTDDLKKSEKMVRDLRIEIERMKSTFECEKSEEGFHMALKAQIEENQRVKDRFKEKDEEIEHLRELNMTLRSQVDSFRNEA